MRLTLAAVLVLTMAWVGSTPCSAAAPPCDKCQGVNPVTDNDSTTDKPTGHKNLREWVILVPKIGSSKPDKYDNCFKRDGKGWKHSHADAIWMSAKHHKDSIRFATKNKISYFVVFEDSSQARWPFDEPWLPGGIPVSADSCSEGFHMAAKWAPHDGKFEIFRFSIEEVREGKRVKVGGAPGKDSAGPPAKAGAKKITNSQMKTMQVGPVVGADG